MNNNLYTVLKCMYALPFNTILVQSCGKVLMKKDSVVPVMKSYGNRSVKSAKIDFDELVIEI